jgi:two-component system sensor histidine kinase CreC
MRDKLEGKEYVEELMHTLAHELKSPIAAIQGSAELLREDMPAERARALPRQYTEPEHAPEAADRQAAGAGAGGKAAAPSRRRSGQPARTGGSRSHDDCGAASLPRAALTLEIGRTTSHCPATRCCCARRSATFSTTRSISRRRRHRRPDRDRARDDCIVISVRDHGPACPDYAQERLFERFYSLPRPDGAKSTGLGLPFVREGGRLAPRARQRGQCAGRRRTARLLRIAELV